MRITQRRKKFLYSYNPLPPVLFDLQTELTAAGATANAAPGTTATVTLPPGTISVPALITWPDVTAEGSTVVLNGGNWNSTTLKMVPGFSGDNMMKLSTTTLSNPWITESNPTTLSSVVDGATTITRTAGTVPTSGWYLLADDALLGDGTGKWKAYIVKVASVSGDVCTLDRGAPTDFNVGTVQMWRVDSKVSRGVRLQNLTIDGYVDGVGYMDTPLFGWGLATVRLDNVRIKNYGISGIQIFRSRDAYAYDTEFLDMDPSFYLTSGHGRGLDLYWTDGGECLRIYGRNLRHLCQCNGLVNYEHGNVTAVECHSACLDAHGMDSRHIVWHDFDLTPASTNDGTMLKVGNESFQDSDRDFHIYDGDLNGGNLLTQGAVDCLIENVVGIQKHQFASYNNASVGLRVSSNVRLNQCVLTAPTTDLVNDGFVGFDPTGTEYVAGYYYYQCLLKNPNANTVQVAYSTDLGGNSDFTFDQTWFDKSVGTNGPAYLSFGTAAASGTLTLKFLSCGFNLNSGDTSLCFRYSTSNGHDQLVDLTMTNNQQYGNGLTFQRSSGGNITDVSVTGNVAYSAAETIPSTVSEMLAIMAGPHE